ncbi:MAG: hypothetical protein LBJ00_09315 [Planctomycetaceae bacterium]|nr:hypothetical protein [Planctomycetaceae bacterium]
MSYINILFRLIRLCGALYSSCFKIPEAAANLQRGALGKRNNVKRLFKGEVYRPTDYGISFS